MSFIKSIFRKFFQEELDGLQNKLKVKDMLINKQNDEIQKERTQLKKAEGDKSILRREILNLKNENFELKERNKSLQKDLEAEKNIKERNWKVVVSERDAHSKEIKISNEKFYKQIAEIENQKNDEIQSLKNEIEESEKKLQISNVLISKLSKDCGQKDEEIYSKEQELTNLINHLNKQNSNIIDLENEKQTLINDYELEINRKKLLINNQNITLAEISKTKQRLEDLMSKKDLEIKELKNKVSEVSKKVSSLEDEKERQLEELKSKEEEKIELNQVIENIRKSNSDLTRNNENLSEQIIEKETIIKEKEDIISAQQSKISDLEKELNKIESHKVADSIVKAMRDEIVSKDEEIKDLEKKIQSLNETISDLRDENSKHISGISNLNNKNNELVSRIDTLSNIYANSIEIEDKLNRTLRENEQLKTQIEKLPKLSDLEEKEREIKSLKDKIEKLEKELAKIDNDSSTIPQNNNEEEPIKDNDITPFIDNKLNQPSQVKTSNNGINIGSGKPIRLGRPVKLPTPYRKKINPVSQILEKKNFPPIENDNKYSITQRLIDQVYNVRTHKLISAAEIFLCSTAEEITYLTRELVKAKERNMPYLVCPSCNQMVTIASRRCGWANNFKEVNYFTHAVKNIPCDLKKEPPYSSLEGDFIDNEEGNENIKIFRQLIGDALTTPLSKNMGISEVNIGSFIYSEELPIMKRRLADVTAKYNNYDIVFELVSETTGIRKVYDRDRFYLINNKQVFWIFGLEAVVDYNELRRTVAKDILFTNRRNVFVFDKEAQDESKKRGELILKCNWLDEDNEWFYRIEKNGKNGLLISLDQIQFDQEDCRPFYLDADTPYFNAHPTAARPVKTTREELKNEILQQYEYEKARNKAYHEMETTGTGVSAFYDGEKWGFNYDDLILIEPTFIEEPEFVGNLIRVKEKDKYGVLNRFGEYLLKPEFEKVEVLPNGNIIYSDGKDWKIYGLIGNLSTFNQTDYIESRIEPNNENILYLSIHKNLYANQPPQEIYFVKENIFIKDPITGKWSLWYSNGEKWADTSFDSFEITPDGKIKVTLGGKTQLLTMNGEIIEEKSYKTITILSKGYSLVETLDNKFYIVDSDKNQVTEEYLKIEKITDDYLKYYKDGKWGIITNKGIILTLPEFSDILSFDGISFIATIPDPELVGEFLKGFIDIEGRKVEEEIYELENDRIIFKTFQRYGLRINNEIILSPIYRRLRLWYNDKYIAKFKGKFGIIDETQQIVLPFEYKVIKPITDGKSMVIIDEKPFHIDTNLNVIEDEIIDLIEGFQKIKKGGKWGILNPEKEIIVDFKYDEITTFRGRLIGIINKELIKLSAYYPYKLPMIGKNINDKDKDLIDVAGVKFLMGQKRTDKIINKKIEVNLINWVYSHPYPIVQIWDFNKLNAKSRHIDKPEDFITGITYKAEVINIIKAKGINGKLKGVEVKIDSSKLSYIYMSDFKNSNIDFSNIAVGNVFQLNKIGYNEELDRTKWKVSKL